MTSKTNCCGFNLDLKRITFLGLLTFSFPLLISGSILYLILIFPSKFISTVNTLKNNLELLLKTNCNLINSMLNLKIRFKLSGKIFFYSPKLAGFIYKYFNLSLLCFLWALILMANFIVLTHLTKK